MHDRYFTFKYVEERKLGPKSCSNSQVVVNVQRRGFVNKVGIEIGRVFYKQKSEYLLAKEVRRKRVFTSIR